MKPENTNARKTSVSPRGRSNVRMIPHLPMEWMDPMSWRLPSGKALAEFALQAGFLAPLMLGTPTLRRKRVNTQPEVPVKVDKHTGEGPERSGTFRETR
jgi:hypothetical protein